MRKRLTLKKQREKSTKLEKLIKVLINKGIITKEELK